MTLFDRWQQIVDERPEAVALTDAKTQRAWTFAEVTAEVEQMSAPNQRATCPPGMEIAVIFETLRAWRHQTTVCPIEWIIPEPEWFENLPANTALLKLGPGSAAKKRAIRFTPEQLIADTEQICDGMGLRPDWPNLGVVSMAHSYGFSSLVLPLLLKGVPLVWIGDAMPAPVAKALESTGEATIPGVPALWRAWFEAGILGDRVKLAISAGAPLTSELETSIFREIGLKIHNFYGASECGGIAFDSTDEPRTDESILGEVLDGVSVEVTETGSFLVQSGAVGAGYWPSDNGNLTEHGFLVPDLGEVSGKTVMLRQRRADLVNVAARKVHPRPVEQVILDQPGVLDVRVLGEPSRSPEHVEDLVAQVRLAEDANIKAIRKSVRGKLAAYEFPRRWVIVEGDA